MTQSQANQEQSQYWNEQAGPKWVRRQAQLDTQIEPLGLAAMQHADIKPGERVLDIGCGCGQTALELAERVGPNGSVLGADLSQPMLARAQERQREQKLNNLTFVQADAQTYAFAQEHFDLVFSRFGVMFFADPTAAFQNLQTALRPDGRMCFLCWQPLAQNDWVTVPLGAVAQHVSLPPPLVPGTPGPFSLGDPDHIREILGAAGFANVGIELHETDLNLGGAKTVDEAVTFLLEIGPMVAVLRDAEEAVRQQAIEEVRTALRPYASADGVQLHAATWIVTARPAG